MTDPNPTPRATFRPHERIKDPAEFRRAFERRRAVSDAALVVHAVENRRDHARLGIVVGRKKFRRAVVRNRLKRVIREAFRLGKAQIPAGLDLVVLPRDPGLTLDQARRSLPRLAADAARRLAPRPGREPPP